MIDFETATLQELINEHEICQQDWGKYSSDCFSFYISALHKEILKRGGYTLEPKLEQFKYSKNVIRKDVIVNIAADFFDKP